MHRSRLISAIGVVALTACPRSSGSGSPRPGEIDGGTRGAIVLIRAEGSMPTPADLVVDFGSARVGAAVERTLSMANQGSATVTATAQASSGFDRAFSYALPRRVLEPGQQTDLTLTFHPLAPGEFAAALELHFENGEPATMRIAVRAIAFHADIPTAQVAPAALDFANVAIGTNQLGRVTIANVGDDVPGTTRDNLLLATCSEDGSWVESPPVINGPNAADFSVEWPPQGYTTAGLATGQRAELSVRFAPSAAGVKQATLVIRSNDPSHPTTEVSLSGAALDQPPCELDVKPPSIDIGTVEPGKFLTLHLAIVNRDPDPTHVCTIDRIEVSSVSVEVELLEGEYENCTITGGHMLLVPIHLHATAEGPISDAIDILVGAQVFKVPVTGTVGSPACLMIAPRALDFGTVNVDCSSRERAVTLFNTCSSAVTITGLELPYDPGSFSISTALSLPRTLPGGGQAAFGVSYRPTDAHSDVGILQIAVAGGGTSSLPLSGVGAQGFARTDVFTEPAIPMTDILFVIDDSPTMTDRQATLATSFSTLIADLQGVDYHIAITTTDMTATGAQGRFVPLAGTGPRIITPSTPDAAQALARNAAVGTGGSESESLLRPVISALTAPLLDGHNASFYRDEARLAVVIVSDAIDQDPLGTSTAVYEAFLVGLKGSTRRNDVSVSAVLPLSRQAPTGCSYDSANAGLDTRIRDLVRATGGIAVEVCSPSWALAIGRPLVSRTTWFLSETPDMNDGPEPIVITVDGQPWPRLDANGEARWSFDAQRIALVFEPSARPGPGTTVRVTYPVACRP